MTGGEETMCVHVFVSCINRIRVMRYWWGTDTANKRRRKKKRAKNRKEGTSDKYREVDGPEMGD